MPEPTDHRAEAEDWLDTAKDMWAGSDKTGATRLDYGSLAARIGIGHALLAGPAEKVTPKQAGQAHAEYLSRHSPMTVDELLPTITDDQVPAGSRVYAPSASEILVYVGGRWHRKAITPARIDELAGLSTDQAEAGVTSREVLEHRE